VCVDPECLRFFAAQAASKLATMTTAAMISVVARQNIAVARLPVERLPVEGLGVMRMTASGVSIADLHRRGSLIPLRSCPMA
jgi:hypothetical protein